MPSTIQIYRIVYRITLCFLLLPLILWTSLWLKPVWALIFTILMVSSGVVLWRSSQNIEAEEGEEHAFNWKAYLAIVAPMLLLTLVTGIAGLGPQMGDWNKHNTILYDLSTRPWPVIFNDWKGDFAIERPYLSFYLAYYLPAALIAKLFANPFIAANWLLLVWTQFALCLVAVWLMLLTRSTKWWLGLVFCSVGGFQEEVGPFLNFFHISTHVLRLQYEMPSAVTLLSWVPHHTVAVWLGAPLLLGSIFRRNWNFSLPALTFWWAVLVFWSPFVAVGSIPWLLISSRRKLGESVRARPNILLAFTAGAWLLLCAVYFAQRIPIDRMGYFPENSFLPREYVLWMGWKAGLAGFFFRYAFMVVLIWGVPCFFMWRWYSNGQTKLIAESTETDVLISRNVMRILIITCATVFFIGLFRVGIANDLFLRGVIPSYLALFFLGYWLWERVESAKYLRAIFLVGLLITTIRPITNLFNRTQQMTTEKRWVFRMALLEKEKNISLTNANIQQYVRRQQYLGLPNSIFARYFLKDEHPFKIQAVAKTEE